MAMFNSFATIALVVVWIVVFASATPAATDTAEHSKEQENTKNTRNCKALCEHCGCMGFYCGEECICECNNDKSDTECIAVMQGNARKLNIPFELLIQGPSANGFVHKAQQYEQNAERRNIVAGRNRRSTVVIYTPAQQNSLYGQCEQKAGTKKELAVAAVRHKRSVGQLDWFSDFANTLVRPAPKGGAKRADEQPIAPTPQKRAAKEELDRSWFSDNNNLLLKPAPLFRRRSSTKDGENGSFDMPIAAAVEKIPRVIKDTIRNIQESNLNEDISDVFRTKMRDGGDAYQPPSQNMPIETLRDNFFETMSNLRSQMFRNDVDVPKVPPPTPVPDTPPQFMIPWFRPGRFLQRVQEALN